MWLSRVSSLDTRSEQPRRRPRSTSRSCAAETARSDGIAARPLSGGCVAQADDCCAVLDERGARVGYPLDRAPETFLGVEGRVDELGLERGEPGRGDEERRKRDERGQRPLSVDRRPRADERGHGHHGALAVVVDRRVRHLREPLAEVGGERPCTAGKRRDRRVVAHRIDGVPSGLRDRAEHEAQLLARVAVQRVARDELVLGRRDPVARLAEANALRHPGRVRAA